MTSKILILTLAFFSVGAAFAADPEPLSLDRIELCARLFEAGERHGEWVGPENVPNSLWIPLGQLEQRIRSDRSELSREDRAVLKGRAWLASYLDEYNSFWMPEESEGYANARELVHRLERLSSLRRRATRTEAPLRYVIEGRDAVLEALAPVANDAARATASARLDPRDPISFAADLADLLRVTTPWAGAAQGPYYNEFVVDLPLVAPRLSEGEPLTANQLRDELVSPAVGAGRTRQLRVHLLLFSDGRDWTLHLYAFEQRFADFWVVREQAKEIPRKLADFLLHR